MFAYIFNVPLIAGHFAAPMIREQERTANVIFRTATPLA